MDAVRTRLRRAFAPTVSDIVESGLCMGCGVCESVAGRDRLQVCWDAQGACRPHVRRPLDGATEATIRRVCPGLRMQLPAGGADAGLSNAVPDDLIFGRVLRMVEAYAADPDIRHAGSSGGVLTGLALHLLESGHAKAVLHVAASTDRPMRTVSHVSRTRDDVLRAAGSRYGPAAPLTQLERLLAAGEPFAVIGKPCDIAAVRNVGRRDARVRELVVALLTVMCGGQADMPFLWGLLEANKLREGDVLSFRCRGNGCPGPTSIEARDGRRVELAYDEVWGDAIHEWGLPYRCKICPDSQGEQADIMAFDSIAPEHADEDTEGFNTVIVRTRRGAGLLREAQASGSLTVTKGLDLSTLAYWQSHIVRRREGALARLAGTALRNGVVPRVGGYRLLRAAGRDGVRGFAGNAVGAWRRAGRARETISEQATISCP
jgi:coenzyme F420 hydrogenase subunit beta